jgi:putative cell wall-binding protein
MHLAPENVYRGLAAFYLLENDAEDALGLPSGARDVPLLLQDRTFAADGSLVYDASAHNGFIGDTLVVNGVASPFFQVQATRYRFRLVNGANARSFEVALANGDILTQVASDGGLLPAPASVASITLAAAERAEFVIDFAKYGVGQELVLVDKRSPADAPGLLRFDVTAAGAGSQPPPATLRTITPLDQGSVTRDVVLSIDATGVWLINGRAFDPARIDYFPRFGTDEVWRVRNDSTFVHPFHTHLVMFQVLDRNGAPPPPVERGWKDTVRVSPGETVRLVTRFDGFVGTYVFHCHIFEHNEHSMMAQFCVVDLSRLAGSGRVETAAAVSAAAFSAGVPAAYVATADGFADALAAGPAAAKRGAPVLLTSGASLPAATAAELDRLKPGRIVVLGGPAAVPDSVVGQLASHTSGAVDRLAGDSRYATAAAVSAEAFSPGVPVAYVATGRGFADALGGGAAAAAEGGPLLLVDDGVPAATDAELRRLQPKHIVVLGGSSAVPNAVVSALGQYTTGGVERVGGADRYETAVLVSRRTFKQPVTTVVVATGVAYPDALAGAPAARASGPLLLVAPDRIPDLVADELRRLAPKRIWLLGGPAAVSSAVESQLAAFLPGAT